MTKNGEIIQFATQIIENEANAIIELKAKLDDDFAKVVALVLENKGNLVFSGIGKSALIAQKIVATMNSTGTTAVFMHAADAIHGDLGIVREGDIVVILSKSGETPEIKMLVPLIKLRGNKIVAMVGNRQSYLASQADFVLDVTVDEEAIPGSLAPTSSTTAQLVMGDALALILMRCRGFSTDDFAKFIHYFYSNDIYMMLSLYSLKPRHKKAVCYCLLLLFTHIDIVYYNRKHVMIFIHRYRHKMHVARSTTLF